MSLLCRVMLSLFTTTVVFGCAVHLKPKEPTWISGGPAYDWTSMPAEGSWLWHTPIGVYLDIDNNVLYRPLYEAVDAFNNAVGCDIFRIVLDPKDAGAVVTMTKDGVIRPTTELSGSWLVGGTHAEVRVNNRAVNEMNTTQLYLMFYHDLGHVIGLTHDAYQRLPTPERYTSKYYIPMFVSIMTPNVVEHAVRLEYGLFLPSLSSNDSDAVNQRFCKQIYTMGKSL